jgi:hypothetical protein
LPVYKLGLFGDGIVEILAPTLPACEQIDVTSLYTAALKHSFSEDRVHLQFDDAEGITWSRLGASPVREGHLTGWYSGDPRKGVSVKVMWGGRLPTSTIKQC